MNTIICIATGQEFFGKVVKSPCKVCRVDGELIDYWLFEVDIDGNPQVWECHSDYWELINNDLRKVANVLRINESQETNVLAKIKNILKWGFCK